MPSWCRSSLARGRGNSPRGTPGSRSPSTSYCPTSSGVKPKRTRRALATWNPRRPRSLSRGQAEVYSRVERDKAGDVACSVGGCSTQSGGSSRPWEVLVQSVADVAAVHPMGPMSSLRRAKSYSG
ncbi:hypothetical protein Pcinc_004333 [Petrolisthes cinctipes]|uniref:Uncharacterized protein n=1 Tax=Petrolisthes cinctipes TaxID=88211 RepID=A0AAE1GEP3_PETCI|nr:hypothetical protein Pcinc_004333 [Petrolisthes cinctipes]